MEHISRIAPLKKIPKLNKYQATQVWQITENLLPNDCGWRVGKDLSIEVLELIGYMYLRNEHTDLNKICISCIKTYPEVSCPQRAKYLV